MPEEVKRDYYLPSEIKSLLDNAKRPSSTFYTFVREKKIRKYSLTQEGSEVYAKADVDAYLAGKMTKRGGKGRKKAQETGLHMQTASIREQQVAIDTAQPTDFLNLYSLESGQLDYMRAIMPPILHGWTQANDLVYWLLYSPGDRAEIIAMLGILPLPEEVIQRLKLGEMTFLQVRPEEVQPYQSGKHYHCMIVSAATKTGQQDMIMPLIKRAFSDWGKRSIRIDSLYALMADDEDSPLARIIVHCGFTSLDEEGHQWRLRPFYRKFQPASFVQEYRASVLNEKRNLRSMLLLQEEDKLTVADLREFFEREKREAHERDFTEFVLSHFVIQDDGRVTRTSLTGEGKQRNVFVRPVRDDNDIRAAIRINASLFGASKKFTEDQLVNGRRPWVERNPDIYRVLEVNGDVRGFVLILPLPQRVLDQLLRGEILAGDISVEDIQVYHPGETYNLFLHTLGVHKSLQSNAKRLSGMSLLAGTHKLFIDLARRGIRIGHLYTRSNELDGVNAAAALDMDEITVPGVTHKLVMKLDFTDPTKKSLHGYREALEEYERTHTVNSHS